MEPDTQIETAQIDKEYKEFRSDVEYLAKDLYKSWIDTGIGQSSESLKRKALASIEAASIFFTTMQEALPNHKQ